MDKHIVKSEPQLPSVELTIVNGVIQNLPEIIGAVKEIYTLHHKEKAFSLALKSRLDELNIRKDNFKELVRALTDLSKSEVSDPETKAMYRDMIKTLFESFMSNTSSSQDFSTYLKGH